MQKFFLFGLLGATTQAHYKFDYFINNGVTGAEWASVRQTINFDSLAPVTNVSSDDIRCYQLNPGQGASQTVTVAAGSTVGFVSSPAMYHPGPLQFYMAKAPSGTSAADFQGEGPVWFKIWEDPAIISPSGISWSNTNNPKPSVTIPKCIPPGDYLLRIEQIGLHVAETLGGAQFYLSCAQITVTGGGSTQPAPLVSFPGAYKATDPGILIGIYWPIPTNYTTPGPDVFTC